MRRSRLTVGRPGENEQLILPLTEPQSALLAILLVQVGAEYLVFTVFYLLLATSASSIRRRKQGFFDLLQRASQAGSAEGQPPASQKARE